MNFTNFKKKVEATGLKAIDRGRGHYQISGGPMLVNYYPTKGTIYVAGTLDALTDCVQGGQGREAKDLPGIGAGALFWVGLMFFAWAFAAVLAWYGPTIFAH